jgi:hypothetical protein
MYIPQYKNIHDIESQLRAFYPPGLKQFIEKIDPVNKTALFRAIHEQFRFLPFGAKQIENDLEDIINLSEIIEDNIYFDNYPVTALPFAKSVIGDAFGYMFYVFDDNTKTIWPDVYYINIDHPGHSLHPVGKRIENFIFSFSESLDRIIHTPTLYVNISQEKQMSGFLPVTFTKQLKVQSKIIQIYPYTGQTNKRNTWELEFNVEILSEEHENDVQGISTTIFFSSTLYTAKTRVEVEMELSDYNANRTNGYKNDLPHFVQPVKQQGILYILQYMAGYCKDNPGPEKQDIYKVADNYSLIELSHQNITEIKEHII